MTLGHLQHLTKKNRKNYIHRQYHAQPERGYVATLPTCRPLLILSVSRSVGDPQNGKVDVGNPPTCGTMLILSRALKCWGPPFGEGVM